MDIFKEKAKILSPDEIKRTIYRLTHQVLEAHADIENVVLIGIETRGVHLARRVRGIIKELKCAELPLGILDITLYRDDLTTVGFKPEVKATQIEFDLNDKVVVLIDDVLFTGRTIRAALDEIMDFGRPSKIELLVLVDRGHRELPIRADYVGKNIPTAKQETIKVCFEETDGKDEVILGEKD